MSRVNDTLTQLLTYRRPAGSKSERQAIRRFIDTIPGIRSDAFGNRILRIGSSSTMISVHTDTVHTMTGRQDINVSLSGVISLKYQSAVKSSKHFRDCLGADDGAGIYAALRMIAANVPALYVFHRAEEIGGHGSSFIARNTPTLLAGINRCIALDRRGQEDIITHQMMGRCASDSFAWEFSDLLGMEHAPCAFGSFTDSANYTDLIPECTNVSIGYDKEHSARETLNTDYVEALIDRLCSIDLESLPCERLPGESLDWRDEREDEVQRSRSYLDTFEDEPSASQTAWENMTNREFLEWLKR